MAGAITEFDFVNAGGVDDSEAFVAGGRCWTLHAAMVEVNS